MSIQKTTQELLQHKDKSVNKLNTYLSDLINSNDPSLMGKSDKLSYWINDWVNYLDFETKFDPLKLKKYKRGEIIKVHLGFNIGSEEGGLHYAVVLDADNNKSSPTITVVPLTSVKSKTDLISLRPGNIYLGNELFDKLRTKIKASLDKSEMMLKQLSALDSIATNVVELMNATSKEIELCRAMNNEIQRLKYGSIALINQITTISKIRIYDPKTNHNILSGIKLSSEKLNLIDLAIIKTYTKLSPIKNQSKESI